MDAPQGTADWFAQRLGKVTASRIADVIVKTKAGWGAARGTYMLELLAEQLTRQNASHYVSPAMQWGTDNEPFAREAYELHTGELVSEVGFAQHPTIAMSGASPDGLVGSAGLIEIKCPTTATHLDTLLSGVVPTRYVSQMQWQMACTGREWCDYASYDPRLPEHARLFVRRVPRDVALIASLETDVCDFLAEITAKINTLKDSTGAGRG